MPTATRGELAARARTDSDAVMTLLETYFRGLYDGDVKSLRSIFHDDAWLKANGYRKSRDEWLDDVANRPAPREQGFEYGFKVLSLEIVNDQALAKVNVPLPAAHYIDYLSLLREDGRWRIVNKMFTTT